MKAITALLLGFVLAASTALAQQEPMPSGIPPMPGPTPPVLDDGQQRIPHQADKAPSPETVRATAREAENRLVHVGTYLGAMPQQNAFLDDAEALFFSAQALYNATFVAMPKDDAALKERATNFERTFTRVINLLKSSERFIEKSLKPPKEPARIKKPEKDRHKASEWLQQLTKDARGEQKAGKLRYARQLLTDGERHYEIADGKLLLDIAEKLYKELEAKKTRSDPMALLATWQFDKHRLSLLLDETKRLLEDAPMKEGVSKKGIQAELDAIDRQTGCMAFRAYGDLYTVCRKHGGPPEKRDFKDHENFTDLLGPNLSNAKVMASLEHDRINAADVPQVCTDRGKAVIKSAPNTLVWKYCDAMGQMCEYYAFVEKFPGLEALLFKKDFSYDELLRVFISSCMFSASTLDYTLVYRGPHPVEGDNLLQYVWRSGQGANPPADMFGTEGMISIAKALGAEFPFNVEITFDRSFADYAKRLSAATDDFVGIMTGNARITDETLKNLYEKWNLKFENPKLYLKADKAFAVKSHTLGGSTFEASAHAALEVIVKGLKEDHPLYKKAVATRDALGSLSTEIGEKTDRLMQAFRDGNAVPKMEIAMRLGDDIFPVLWFQGTPLPKAVIKLSIDAHILQDGQPVDVPLKTVVLSHATYPGAYHMVTTMIADQKYFLVWFNIWDLRPKSPGSYRLTVTVTDEAVGKGAEKVYLISVGE